MIIVSITNSKLLNAGPKAKLDIVHILKNEYKEKVMEKTLDFKLEYDKENSILKKIVNNSIKMYYILKTNFYKGVKIFQYPLCNKLEIMQVMPRKNVILFIHDLMGIRNIDKNKIKKEIKFLKGFDYLVVHNEKMKKYLIEQGIKNEHIYVLELFDYLCEEVKNKHRLKSKRENVVVYVGNLKKEKCPFIYQINKNINFQLKLYGQGIEKIFDTNIKYEGSMDPYELPDKIIGDLGLVWDGNYDESDENDGFKNYTKYNNPHKLSCYIAAGIPVIVWRKSAIADFVDKYNIGYKISNIYDINNLDLSDYDEKLKNVQELSQKVRQGYFTQRVINEILADIEKIKK